MKQNKYDDANFFKQYSQMQRSVEGLKGAGEWHVLRTMLPDFKGKRVLDLGCGFGWHCRYAIEQGAKSVIGVDISEKMLAEARKHAPDTTVEYICSAVEDIDFSADSFDIVISSLAFHYIESFDDICSKIKACLVNGGDFVFSIEHPIFTSYGTQDWYYDESGNRLHWPVDNYFMEGLRKTNFLGEEVTKYHKTVTTYVNGLIKAGFQITGLIEPEVDPRFLEMNEEMKNELRRPMFLIISAKNSK
ncbi:class I SAM-dependent methyltransferase [Dysgonomonas sp. HGC4]|uniref:class I SAM-dependent methyltransferase n=1 Tax=Dysgonomonas sp. HGC4 TaxID=1658009 RepID=UPI00068144C3|nr:class I SAM-dependent methyltransferase [Dysgonomonas sp. HGC4]MBD8348913.1 class I SAM-dependent methyltransferase [Dysgonomonas sp. HGC4]